VPIPYNTARKKCVLDEMTSHHVLTWRHNSTFIIKLSKWRETCGLLCNHLTAKSYTVRGVESLKVLLKFRIFSGINSLHGLWGKDMGIYVVSKTSILTPRQIRIFYWPHIFPYPTLITNVYNQAQHWNVCHTRAGWYSTVLKMGSRWFSAFF